MKALRAINVRHVTFKKGNDGMMQKENKQRKDLSE